MTERIAHRARPVPQSRSPALKPDSPGHWPELTDVPPISFNVGTQSASHNHGRNLQNFPPEYPALVPGRWVGLLVAAVVLAEAIWGLLVSLTNNLYI